MSDFIPPTDEARKSVEEIAAHFEAIIKLIGEDPSREGLLKTPMRAAKALYYATQGYRTDIDEVVNGAMFESTSSGMIVVRDIEFYSFCEHHILPFFGKVSIGYIPGDKIIGLSKLARIVDMYARRLQVQERMTAEICAELDRLLGAKGVIVTCRGQHLCMKMRGVEKQDSSAVTTESTGVFDTDNNLRREFFDSVR